jgi:hypothetical protein
MHARDTGSTTTGERTLLRNSTNIPTQIHGMRCCCNPASLQRLIRHLLQNSEFRIQEVGQHLSSIVARGPRAEAAVVFPQGPLAGRRPAEDAPALMPCRRLVAHHVLCRALAGIINLISESWPAHNLFVGTVLLTELGFYLHACMPMASVSDYWAS